MAMKIPVSFKENEKELYDYVISQLSASIYIKQLIKNDMEKNKPDIKKVKNKIDFDF